jgi:hypothetical protein
MDLFLPGEPFHPYSYWVFPGCEKGYPTGKKKMIKNKAFGKLLKS